MITAQLYVAQVSAKDQRNQNQPRPMRNQPKNGEIKTTHTHEKLTQRTHREIKTNSYPIEIKPKNA